VYAIDADKSHDVQDGILSVLVCNVPEITIRKRSWILISLMAGQINGKGFDFTTK
jgi:hypothetical protein